MFSPSRNHYLYSHFFSLVPVANDKKNQKQDKQKERDSLKMKNCAHKISETTSASSSGQLESPVADLPTLFALDSQSVPHTHTDISVLPETSVVKERPKTKCYKLQLADLNWVAQHYDLTGEMARLHTVSEIEYSIWAC